MTKKIFILATSSLVFFASAPTANAATVTLLNENFDSFRGTGFAPTPAAGQLDSDIYRVTNADGADGSFGGTHTGVSEFSRGEDPDGVTQSGVYAFNPNSGTDYIFGVQPDGASFTPGTFEILLTAGNNYNSLEIDVDFMSYNDASRSNRLNLTSVRVGADAAGADTYGAVDAGRGGSG